jgi:3-oxoacyl-[acyl-carrier protein] reductase
MYPDLRGKRIVVTGAGQGIGFALAHAFAESGSHVVAVSRRPVENLDARIENLVCDIRTPDPLFRHLTDLEERNQRVDVLINNAALMKRSPLLEATADHISDLFATNVAATLLMSQRFAHHMKVRGGGVIINAGSYAATLPSIAHGVYAATKAAIVMLTASMAAEWAPYGIRVNAFSPGVVPTQMTAPALARNADKMLDLISLRRTGRLEEVANAVLFLASDASSYITGTNLDVSGGKLVVQDPASAWL